MKQVGGSTGSPRTGLWWVVVLLLAGCGGTPERWIVPHGRHPWQVLQTQGSWDLVDIPPSAVGWARSLGGEREQFESLGQGFRLSAVLDPLANAPSPTLGLRAQWGVEMVRADEAWSRSRGEGVIVAVVDTGIDLEHPDLAPNLESGDDDTHGHGTHVAGIIAAAADNGYGVAGVAPRARLLPIKSAEGNGSSLWETAKGIRAAADRGARVINVSIGFRQPSRLLEEAVDHAFNRSAVVVAASGNDGLNGNPATYPAAIDGVVAVAAVTPNRQRADFSVFNSEVAIAAPGVDILSTIPVGFGEFAYQQGTSSAAPFVSGACALLLAKEPNLTPDQVKGRLMAAATDVMSPGLDVYTGAGLLNCAALVP